MRILGAVVAGCALLLSGCGGAATTPAASRSGPLGSVTPMAILPTSPLPTATLPATIPAGSAGPTGSSLPPASPTAAPTRTAAPRAPSAAAVRPSASAPGVATSPTPSAVRTTTAARTPAPSGTVAGSPTPTPAAGCPAAPAPVRMVDDAFTPATVRIGVGTALTMTNCGAKFHTWTSPAAGFDSGAMAKRATFRFAFTTPGTYAFLCSYHPGMTGSVTVD